MKVVVTLAIFALTSTSLGKVIRIPEVLKHEDRSISVDDSNVDHFERSKKEEVYSKKTYQLPEEVNAISTCVWDAFVKVSECWQDQSLTDLETIFGLKVIIPHTVCIAQVMFHYALCKAYETSTISDQQYPQHSTEESEELSNSEDTESFSEESEYSSEDSEDYSEDIEDLYVETEDFAEMLNFINKICAWNALFNMSDCIFESNSTDSHEIEALEYENQPYFLLMAHAMGLIEHDELELEEVERIKDTGIPPCECMSRAHQDYTSCLSVDPDTSSTFNYRNIDRFRLWRTLADKI